MESRCLIGVFRQIAKDLDRQLTLRLKKDQHPVLVTHIPLFFLLPECGESIPFNELSDEWSISKSSLSDVIKRYEELSLIYREDSPVDKRVVHVGMTGQGLELRNQLIQIEDDLLADLMKDLKDSDKTVLEQMLRKIDRG